MCGCGSDNNKELSWEEIEKLFADEYDPDADNEWEDEELFDEDDGEDELSEDDEPIEVEDDSVFSVRKEEEAEVE